jgi:ATP-dependent Clp protease ATP-binding subunit ClpA
MGQWGEEAYEGLNADQAKEKFESMTQEEIDAYFEGGKGDALHGKVPNAILERVRKDGLIFILPPVHPKYYPNVTEMELRPILRDLEVKNGINLEVTPSLTKYVTRVVKEEGLSVRSLAGITRDFTKTALSRAVDKGLPMRNIAVRIRHERDPDTREHFIIVEQMKPDSKDVLKSWSFKANSLRRTKIVDPDRCGNAVEGEPDARDDLDLLD